MPHLNYPKRKKISLGESWDVIDVPYATSFGTPSK